ncbi:capsular polysaccharide export protein, LipB/KpsS family [Aquimarina aggregata]|uniref:capsular polysaccharide export protein, LipB/KpsS family n=1 Tax=Aquimarina aggregata TaxID=1642818 RepID=UPI0012FD33F1|nr:hypothetical protein [Aquimarina aggregata]
MFIENRYKTFFFEKIAIELLKKDHEIFWLIQNKDFAPTMKKAKIFNIPYPKNNFVNRGEKQIEYIEEAIVSDRQVSFFKKKGIEYFYYYNSKIKEILDEVKPNIVFGEATAFHELLTIGNCKEQNILFLNPVTCRYPVGRFSFYKYDTLDPFSGSGEILEREEAIEIIDVIVNKTIRPDYMKNIAKSKREKSLDKIKKIASYYKGDKYNIPNPFIKLNLEKEKKRNIEKWDLSSYSRVEKDSKFAILYPLQMQPEANLDVWGRKYKDQSKLIRSISETIPDDAILFIKPNPKSNYELNKDLLRVVSNCKNIRALHHSVSMEHAFNNSDLIITVTGTVAIESVLANKPVVTLVETINNEAKNCKFINSLEHLNEIIKRVRNNKFEEIDLDEKIDFINKINKTSFKGLLTDPYTNVNVISDRNTEKVINAFEKVLSEI